MLSPEACLCACLAVSGFSVPVTSLPCMPILTTYLVYPILVSLGTLALPAGCCVRSSALVQLSQAVVMLSSFHETSRLYSL